MATEFTAEFLEERMATHRRLRQLEENRLMREIIEEIQELPRRRPKSAMLPFDDLDEFPAAPNIRARSARAAAPSISS